MKRFLIDLAILSILVVFVLVLDYFPSAEETVRNIASIAFNPIFDLLHKNKMLSDILTVAWLAGSGVIACVILAPMFRHHK